MGRISVKNGDLSGEIIMPNDLVNICIKAIDICFSDQLVKWCATALVARELQKRADSLFRKIPAKDLKELENYCKRCN